METYETRRSDDAPAEVATNQPEGEAALIARAQAGDHAAFESIFDAYRTSIFNYTYRLMGSADDANDMTQDTFLKAYLALPRTNDELRVGAWLYRIATNVCLDELRHRKLVKWQPWDAFISVFHPSQVAADSPERDVLKGEDQEEVQLILEQIHPKHRMCLILREYRDLSYDEIGDVLHTTRAAVKSLLFRAREEFRQVYAKVERQPGAERASLLKVRQPGPPQRAHRRVRDIRAERTRRRIVAVFAPDRSYEELARLAGVSGRSVRRHVPALQAAGLLPTSGAHA